jgi:RimJ/RimL family protein N-acetyltransferase
VALDYAFTALKRDRVVSLIRDGNERFVRVAEKIGERYSGEVELLGSMARVYEITR